MTCVRLMHSSESACVSLRVGSEWGGVRGLWRGDRAQREGARGTGHDLMARSAGVGHGDRDRRQAQTRGTETGADPGAPDAMPKPIRFHGL